MRRAPGIGILVLAVILTASCSNRNMYLRNVPVGREGWPADQIMRFEVPVTDTITPCNLYLQIRNDGRYEFSNLWLFVTTHSPTGSLIRDTLECRLADEQGRWLGRGSGGRYSLEIPYRYNIRFPNSGMYLIEIEHGMRASVLNYVTDLGIRIQKSN
jgi:gliding motility-associated lipoprotein GldH